MSWKNLIEGMLEAVWVVDPHELRLLAANNAAARLLGAPVAELVGLPVVELAGRACEGVYGVDGSVLTLAEPDPHSIAQALSALLGDPAGRERLSRAGLDFVRDRTWARSTDAIEEGLVAALRAQLPAWARSGHV